MINVHATLQYCLCIGVLILGDAFNMRHPLTGAGMSTALNDIVILQQSLQDVPHLNNQLVIILSLIIIIVCMYSQQVMSVYKGFQWKRKRSHSFVINILAQALYALFSSPEGKIIFSSTHN